MNIRCLKHYLSITLLVLSAPATASPEIQSRHTPILDTENGQFRDLDQDGRLSPFEDWRLSAEQRAADLVTRLTLAEKAGLTMHSTLRGVNSPIGYSPEGYDLEAMRGEIVDQHINSFITRLPVSPREMAVHNNAIQELAEQARIAIPVTISTDPRNHFDAVVGAAVTAGGYSKWPDFIGFGALADAELMQRFGDIVRQEYRATGIHQALSPQADLFTEPQWPRGTGTFGADPELAHDLVKAYVSGFQGGQDGLQPDGVLTVVKHWVGYGATRHGWDGHNYYGRFVDLSPESFRQHVRAFEGAFDVGVGGVMPTYSILRGANLAGQGDETTGGGFSRTLLTTLLREQHGFNGIVLSDWGITRDCNTECRAPTRPHSPMEIAMPWGVETLAPLQRYALGVNAGIDQFGGVHEPELIVASVNQGLISTNRIDEAAQRVLIPKFRMGLFENPYVDEARAQTTVGRAEIQREADRTQTRAQVLLKNRNQLLPLASASRVWLLGIDPAAARAAGLVPVEHPSQAEIALMRTSTPHEAIHPNHFFGARQHEGRLDFRAGDEIFDTLQSLPDALPAIVSIYADRPPVLTGIEARSDAILVNFGVSDAGLLQVVTGREQPAGRLPFEFPSSMEAVSAQDPSAPDDSEAPLYPFGSGLTLDSVMP